nr:MAG TPA: hypothetical protein [Caudoviricetes sp.]
MSDSCSWETLYKESPTRKGYFFYDPCIRFVFFLYDIELSCNRQGIERSVVFYIY